MTNLGIRTARKQICDFLNGLPFEIEVKRLILKDIYDEYVEASNKAVEIEIASIQKAKEAQDGTGMATSNNSGLEEQPGHDHTAECKQPE